MAISIRALECCVASKWLCDGGLAKLAELVKREAANNEPIYPSKGTQNPNPADCLTALSSRDENSSTFGWKLPGENGNANNCATQISNHCLLFMKTVDRSPSGGQNILMFTTGNFYVNVSQIELRPWESLILEKKIFPNPCSVILFIYFLVCCSLKTYPWVPRERKRNKFGFILHLVSLLMIFPTHFR